MSGKFDIELRVYAGPNLAAPFAAVMAEFQRPFARSLEREGSAARLAAVIPADLHARLDFGAAPIFFERLAAGLARAIHEYHGALDLPFAVQVEEPARCRILLGYHDAQAASLALETGIELALAVFADLGAERLATLVAKVARAVTIMRRRQPDPLARLFIGTARARGIPVHRVSIGRVWLYGQGRAGRHLFEAASENDAMTGARLARDKYFSNELVTRLGLPGVTHGIAHDVASAHALAAKLGYPLVVKPVAGGKGQGVRTLIGDADALAQAFAAANRLSPRLVLVERQVAGDTHRMAVISGRFGWAVRQTTPHVIGDGLHTIAELIEEDNAGRDSAGVAAGLIVYLAVDADMHALLARQGYGLHDRPARGAAVRLRDGSNVARGGRVTDCTESVHADNRALAETIARAFRLDAIGIDFITPDISRSWREIDCAVIEVNTTPGFVHAHRTQTILERYFPDGADGRVPSALVIDAAPAVADLVAASWQAHGLCVGVSSATLTVLDGLARCPPSARLSARVLALIHDPACAALVITASSAELMQDGWPIDRTDAVVVGDAALPPALAALVASCAGKLVSGVTPANFASVAAPVLHRVLRERGLVPPA